MSTGLVFHERYLWHHTGNHADFVPYGGFVEPLQHAESPDTKRRIKSLMEVSGLYEELIKIKPRPASKEEILRFHTESYFEHIKSIILKVKTPKFSRLRRAFPETFIFEV